MYLALFDCWLIGFCSVRVLSFRRILVQGEVAVGTAAAGLAFLTKVCNGRSFHGVSIGPLFGSHV